MRGAAVDLGALYAGQAWGRGARPTNPVERRRERRLRRGQRQRHGAARPHRHGKGLAREHRAPVVGAPAGHHRRERDGQREDSGHQQDDRRHVEALEVDLEVDLGREAAAGAAERLSLLPPLAPAAETWALVAFWAKLLGEIQQLRPQIEAFSGQVQEIEAEFEREFTLLLNPEQREKFEQLLKPPYRPEKSDVRHGRGGTNRNESMVPAR